MKKLLTTALLLLIALLIGGCGQLEVKNTPVAFEGTDEVYMESSLKINTIFMSKVLNSFHYFPAKELSGGGYKGIPADIQLEFDPLTRSFKIKTDSNNLE